jgi:hypothetical protein
MFLKDIRSFFKRILLMLLLTAAVILLLNAFIQRPEIQKGILKRVSNAIGYDIQAKSIEIDIWNGVGFSINDLSARSRQGHGNFTAQDVRLTIDVKELLAGHIIPSTIFLTRPVIEIPWEKEYDLHTDLNGFLPKKVPVFWFPGIHSVAVENGQVLFQGASFYIDEFYCSVGRIAVSPLKLRVIARGQVGYKGTKTGFKLNGNVSPSSEENGPVSIEMKVATDQAPLNWFKWPELLPVKAGLFKTRLEIEGDPSDRLFMKGVIDLIHPEFELRHNDKNKEFAIPEITLDFQSLIRSDKIEVRPVKIKSSDLSIDLDLIFGIKKEKIPFLQLDFKSDFMGVGTFKTLFPSPLLPLWLEDKLFPIFTGGAIKVNNFSLKGDINQIVHMSRPGNQSVMEMLFECQGLEASGGGVQVPFRDVSGEIALKDGLFSVSGVKADFGDSVIKNGEFYIRDIYTPSRFYEILIDGDFDIKELLSQRAMEVVPGAANRQIDQWPGMTGRLLCKTTIGYRHEWQHPRILNGEFLLNGFSLNKKEYKFPVMFDEASIHVDDAGSNHISGSGSWGNNPFTMSASFGLSGMTPTFKNGLLKADVDLNQVLSAFYSGAAVPLTFPESIPCNISLVREDNEWSLNGTLKPGDTALTAGAYTLRSSGKGQDNIAFDVAINPNEKKIYIKDFLLTLNESSLDITGVYNLQTKKFVEADLNSPGLSMKDLSIISDKGEIFSGGAVNGNLKISIPEGDGKDAHITGLIQGADMSLQAGKGYPQISDCSFLVQLADKGSTINYFNVRKGRSLLSITGEIERWRSLKGDITIHSDYLDFVDIWPSADDSSSNSTIDQLSLGIQMDVSGGIWGKLPFGRLRAELDLENGNLFIKNSTVNLDNGDLTIKGHIFKKPNPELLFTGDVHMKDQPVDKLLEELDIGYRGLKGDLTLDGSLSAQGKDKKELVSGLSGSVSVVIQKGLIKNPNVIMKVLDFLSLQKIFEQRPPDLKGEGLFFESITADAVIKKGTLKTENFVMRSPVMNAVAYGTADFLNKKFDFVLGSQPHGTIDSLISKVPILGYIITGENKSIVAYPFEVKGPFSDPDVNFVPFDTLEGGIAGILKRIFFTPVRLYNKIDKALSNKDKNPAQ